MHRIEPHVPERVVIIGGGASGLLVAVRLLMAPQPPEEIVLIEQRPRLGEGVAYSTRDPRHVLNVPANRMSALPEDPDHFVRWLQSRPESEVGSDQAYATRLAYGKYLNALLAEAEQKAPNVRLRRVQDTAVAADLESIKVRVRLQGGESFVASKVVLALGSPPPRSPFLGVDRSDTRVVVDPWTEGALDCIPPSGDLLVLGTGLTMVDIVLALASRRGTGIIHAVSRHGLLPQAHPERRHARPFSIEESFPGGIALRALVRVVRREVMRAANVGSTWHDVMDTLRPIGGELWAQLSTEDRRRFLRHVRPHWEVHRHRMAPSIAEAFDSLHAQGRVRVSAGRLLAIQAADGGTLHARVHPRGGSDAESLQVVAAINATGPGAGWRPDESPLLASLLEAGAVRADALRLGLDARPDGALIDSSGQPSGRLFAIGPLLRGILWETTAIPEIREQARRLALAICDSSASVAQESQEAATPSSCGIAD